MAQLVSLSTIQCVGGYINCPDFMWFSCCTSPKLSVGSTIQLWGLVRPPGMTQIFSSGPGCNQHQRTAWERLAGTLAVEFFDLSLTHKGDVFKTSGPLISQHIRLFMFCRNCASLVAAWKHLALVTLFHAGPQGIMYLAATPVEFVGFFRNIDASSPGEGRFMQGSSWWKEVQHWWESSCGWPSSHFGNAEHPGMA